MRRTFRNPPDPVASMLHVMGPGDEDATRLPLGDLHGHALNRLHTAFAIIAAAQLAARAGRQIPGYGRGIPRGFGFFPVAAPVQDHRSGLGTRYVAAHRAPCALEVGPHGGNPRGQPLLHQMFRHPDTTAYVTALFERTDIVHRLANVVDSRYEEGTRQTAGMRQILAGCCNLAILNPRSDPREIYYDGFVPSLRTNAQRVFEINEDHLGRIEGALTPEDPYRRSEAGLLIADRFRRVIDKPPPPRPPGEGLLVYQYGWSGDEEVRERRTHRIDENPLRENTNFGAGAAIEDQWPNRHAVREVLRIYQAVSPRDADLSTIRQRIDALADNELADNET